jgi:hypothetical protein
MKMNSLRILKITTALLFLGWGLIHVFWDAPYREFLWSEALFRPILEIFGGNWQSYLLNIENDNRIQLGIKLVGMLFIFLSIFSLSNFREKSGRLLFAGSFILAILFLMQYREGGMKFVILLEQTAQFCAPIFLYLFCFRNSKSLLILVKFALAITFLSHGLFAIGVFSVPGPFIDMIINIFGVSETTARSLLFYMGVGDVLFALMIFVPELERPVLIYGSVWGLATALARPVSFVGSGGGEESVFFWIAQTLLRAPHFGLPFFLLVRLREQTTAPAASTVRRSLLRVLTRIRRFPVFEISN